MCMCRSVYNHVCVCDMQSCVCVCVLEADVLLVSSSITLIFWDRTSLNLKLTNSVHLNCMANQLQGSSCLCLPSEGIKDFPATSRFYMGAKKSNLHPHASTASIAPTELSSQASFPIVTYMNENSLFILNIDLFLLVYKNITYLVIFLILSISPLQMRIWLKCPENTILHAHKATK